MIINKRDKKRVTQRDIAEVLGVSQVAVSHVLHQPHRARISEATKCDILRVAREMGYQSRGQTTHTIGIMAEPQNLSWESTSNVISFADEILRERGFRITISTLEMENFAQAPQLFDPKKVDGVIFTDWQPGFARHLKKMSVPWVLIADANEDEKEVDQIGMDTVLTARRLTEYLMARGHRRFCIMTGDEGIGIHERTKRGVFKALEDKGLTRDHAAIIHRKEDKEFEPEILALLRGKNPPTAVIASHPGGALVMLNRLQMNGFRVPQDVSIVSLIDGARLLLFKPTITATTALGCEHIRQAIERLMTKIGQPETIPHRVLLPGEIIERDSVRSI